VQFGDDAAITGGRKEETANKKKQKRFIPAAKPPNRSQSVPLPLPGPPSTNTSLVEPKSTVGVLSAATSELAVQPMAFPRRRILTQINKKIY
jgi:hypothetical protein